MKATGRVAKGKVAWKSGFSVKIDAEVAYREIERIREKNGGTITAADVYADSVRKESPLHDAVFDVSRQEASDRYYMDRAARLLRNLVITVPAGPKEPIRVYPVISQAPEQSERGRTLSVFTNIEEAMRNPDHRQVVLSQALVELAAFRRKYALLSELAVLWPVIDQLSVAN